MTSRILRRAAGSAIACALGFACSGSKPPVANAFLSAEVGPGSGNGSLCGYGSNQDWPPVGSPLSPEPSVTTSGDFEQGWGKVTLFCKVDSTGGGNFNIELSAEVAGPMGGSVTVSGTVNDTTGATGGITGSFTSATKGSFSDSNCSVTFTYLMMPLGVSGSPIAKGRIWGHLSCPNATQQETSVPTEDGGSTQETCDGEADFLFQNCQ